MWLKLAGAVLLSWALLQKAPLKPGDIVVIGDSLGLGVGPAMSRLGLAPRINAIQGTQASWWAQGSRWENSLQGARVAIVSLGSNDIASKRPPWATLHDLNVRAKKLGVRVIWLVPATKLWENQTAVIPGEALSLVGVDEAADGVHLTSKGYAQAAALVKKRLGM